MSMKNPLTPAWIEPATFQFVAQHLHHCTTAVPLYEQCYILLAPVNSFLFKRYFRIYSVTPVVGSGVHKKICISNNKARSVVNEYWAKKGHQSRKTHWQTVQPKGTNICIVHWSKLFPFLVSCSVRLEVFKDSYIICRLNIERKYRTGPFEKHN